MCVCVGEWVGECEDAWRGQRIAFAPLQGPGGRFHAHVVHELSLPFFHAVLLPWSTSCSLPLVELLRNAFSVSL